MTTQKALSIFGLEITRGGEALDNELHIDDSKSSYLPYVVRKFSTIPGMVSLEEGVYLYFLAYSSSTTGDIIEIGSWQGRSTSFLAQGCRDSGNGIVHAIDPFTGNEGKENQYRVEKKDLSDLQQMFIKNIKDANLLDYVKLYPVSAKTARPDLESISARILFIDGNHDYGFVKSDMDMYLSLLKPGGIVVLDDYRPACSGVVKAVKETLLESNQYSSFLQTSSFFIAKKK